MISEVRYVLDAASLGQGGDHNNVDLKEGQAS